MMRKTSAFLFISFLLFVGAALAQVHNGLIDSSILPKTGSSHYEPEYTLDASVNAAAWTNEKPGLHAAFGSEDKLYFRTDVPEIKNETVPWESTGWRGER